MTLSLLNISFIMLYCHNKPEYMKQGFSGLHVLYLKVNSMAHEGGRTDKFTTEVRKWIIKIQNQLL